MRDDGETNFQSFRSCCCFSPLFQVNELSFKVEARRGSVSVPELREVDGERRLLMGSWAAAPHVCLLGCFIRSDCGYVSTGMDAARLHGCGVEWPFTDLTACLC